MENLTPEQENLFLKIRNELDEHLDKRVDEHLEKDRNLIKETISTVSTIFKWTVGIAALLVAILGVKTYLDIKERIGSSIQGSIKAKIDSTNVLSIYDRKASKLYREALIETLIIKLKKRDTESDPFNVQISKIEFDEILHTITDPDTDSEAFKKALLILSNVNLPADSKQVDLNKILTELILNKSKNYHWIDEQDDKKEFLLTSIASLGIDDCKSFCENTLKDKLTKPNIKIAALTYLKKTHNRESLPIIEELVNSEDEDIQSSAFQALAYLDYRNKKTQDWISKVTNGKIGLSDAKNLIDVLNEILLEISDDSKRRRFSFDETQKQKDKTDSTVSFVAKNLLKIQPYIKFSASSSFYNKNYHLSIYSLSNQSIYYGIPSDIIFGFDYAVVNQLLRVNDINEFRKIVDFLTVQDGYSNSDKLDFNAVAADLKYGGAIITEAGRMDRKIIDNMCWFKIDGKVLKLNFWDKGGNLKDFSVMKLQGVDSIRFSLQTKNKLSKDYSNIDGL